MYYISYILYNVYIYIFPFFLLKYLDVVTSTYHHSTEICTMDTVRPSCWSFRQNCSARASAVQCAALWPAFLALPLHHIWFLLQGARGSPLNVPNFDYFVQLRYPSLSLSLCLCQVSTPWPCLPNAGNSRFARAVGLARITCIMDAASVEKSGCARCPFCPLRNHKK